MPRRKTFQLALCGMMTALSVLLLLCGGIIPFATYCAPALAAVLALPVLDECGAKPALTMYVATSLLAVILVPDKELAGMYVLVLGYYPVIKQKLDCIRAFVWRVAAKLLAFNVALAVLYALLLMVFTVPGLAEDLFAEGKWMLILLIVTGNLAFLLYDKALANLAHLYKIRLRPALHQKMRHP